MAGLLKDVRDDRLQPIYNYLDDLPALAEMPGPYLPEQTQSRAGLYASLDGGRGCPFECSFCTIINVQGRQSRYRTPEEVAAIVRANAHESVRRIFITDDNFAGAPLMATSVELDWDAFAAGKMQLVKNFHCIIT